MAHPHCVAASERPNALKQRRLPRDFNLGAPELPLVVGFDASAQLRNHGLLAVTDAKHGHAEFKHALRRAWRTGIADTGWPTRQTPRRPAVFFQRLVPLFKGGPFALDAAIPPAPHD